jgi:UDP:flavonoid glycosyltransferase YjiC (YdhE family)
MSTGAAVVVLSPGGGHLQRLLPLIAGLVRRARPVHVLTRAEGRAAVEATGAAFIDLLARFPLDAVDAESIPLPSRWVTFAAAYAEPLIAAVGALRPGLIVYDSFAVAAPLIGRRLGVPYVGMRAGHAQVPAAAIAELRADPRVVTSPACRAAVETLRAAYDMPDASPFSYLDGVSPYLNLYPEPPQFLDGAARRAFEPLAFFGSLAPDLRDAAAGAPAFAPEPSRLRVYMSFGSVIWRYYADIARAAMRQLIAAFSAYDAQVLVGFGGQAITPADRARLGRPRVRLDGWADQWSALADADLFVTHHGLNSTHEAVFHRVPMLSYPFFGDQPAMARDCQRLGIAVPLADAARAPLDAAAVRRAIDDVLARRHDVAARLEVARRWELDVIDGREAVLDRMLALG